MSVEETLRTKPSVQGMFLQVRRLKFYGIYKASGGTLSCVPCVRRVSGCCYLIFVKKKSVRNCVVSGMIYEKGV